MNNRRVISFSLWALCEWPECDGQGAEKLSHRTKNKKLKKLENVGETRANAVEKAKTEKRATTTSKCTTEGTETRKWVQFGRI